MTNNRLKKSNNAVFMFSLSVFIIFGLFLPMTSLVTQDPLSQMRDYIVSKVVNKNDSIFFSVYTEGKRIESIVDDPSLYKLRNKYYSAILASRFFDASFYLSVSDGITKRSYDVAALESQEKPRDSNSSIIHGLLPVKFAESVKVENFSTNYNYLSSSDDAIYIPENLAETILSDFDISSYTDMLFSENPEAGFSGMLSIEFMNSRDESFSIPLKIRGIYANNSLLSNKLLFLAQESEYLTICSPGLFDRISFNENKLMCLIKPHVNLVALQNHFFDFVSLLFINANYKLDFSMINVLEIRDGLINKYTQINNSNISKYKWLFICLAIIVTCAPFVIAFIYRKKVKYDFLIHGLITIGIYAFVLTLARLIGDYIEVVFPTRISIFYSSLVLLILEFGIFTFSSRKPLISITSSIITEFNEINI